MTRQTLFCHLSVKIIKIVQFVSFQGNFVTNTVTRNIYTLEIQDTNRIHFNLLPEKRSTKMW